MSIIVKTEKVVQVVEGVPTQCRKILYVEALSIEDLPQDYLEGDPMVISWISEFQTGKRGLFITVLGKEDQLLEPGDIISEELFQQLLGDIEIAGQKLTDINIRRRLEIWKGEETFTI